MTTKEKSKFWAMEVNELETLLADLKNQLMHNRAISETGKQPEIPTKKIRRSVARAETILTIKKSKERLNKLVKKKA